MQDSLVMSHTPTAACAPSAVHWCQAVVSSLTSCIPYFTFYVVSSRHTVWVRKAAPMVLSWNSWNWPFKKQSTRLDLPTAGSPRSTSSNRHVLFPVFGPLCLVAAWLAMSWFDRNPRFQTPKWTFRMQGVDFWKISESAPWGALECSFLAARPRCGLKKGWVHSCGGVPSSCRSPHLAFLFVGTTTEVTLKSIFKIQILKSIPLA